ncbi:MAG: NHL repeat-containing protein [Candidatus Zixiibacteriota bacterium]|nr:MAG: NHL repeat-containing protein [candidate division Zixibacteria bacterium]
MNLPACSPNNSTPGLLATLIISAALTACPPLAIAQPANLEERITITEIAFDDGWQTKFRGASALFADERAGELFVADGGNSRIVILDEKLQSKFVFDHYVADPRTGRSLKGEPRDVVVNSRGEIILVDNLTNQIEVLDFRGKLLEIVEPNKLYGDTTLTIKPQRLAIDRSDRLYVATGGDLITIMVLDDYYSLERTIGKRGSGEEDFNTILTLQVHDGRIYATDLYAQPAVKVFDTSGAYLFGFGGHDVERDDLSFPSGLAILEVDPGVVTIWVADGLRQVIKVYDDSGEFLQTVGGFGFRPGEFRYPADLAVQGDSVIYIVERVGNRIQRFDFK